MQFLDPVLSWSLNMHPFLAILILSFVVTMISNLIYKYTTNQTEMKSLKMQIEKQRKLIKESRDNPKKMMKLNNEAMQVNMKYMGKTIKPMLFTFIPIILLISWMSTNFTYAPLPPGEPLTVTAYVNVDSGNFTLKGATLEQPEVTAEVTKDKKGRSIVMFPVRGTQGSHDFTIYYNNDDFGGNSGQVFFGDKPTAFAFEGKGPIQNQNGIMVEYPKIRPLGNSFNLWGWYPGWLAVYIILAILLSFSTRKMMKIY